MSNFFIRTILNKLIPAAEEACFGAATEALSWPMLPLARIAVDQSQFPEQIRLDLLESLRLRKVNHKFHYDSVKQAQQWFALHEAYSPARTDPAGAQVYQASFAAAAQKLESGPVHLVGLGCGGGQKDTALLRLLRQSGRPVTYTPCDVSTAMVLVARQSALTEVSNEDCFPLVCDLATAKDLRRIIDSAGEGIGDNKTARLVTFFGMLPNFEPAAILAKLAQLVDPGEFLLLSANLAPGDDYTRGVQRVMPLYDNELTREWLLSFLLDLGIERSDGQVRFEIEQTSEPIPLLRIVAHFQFIRERTVQVDSTLFQFRSGENIRLFFSYRHTPDLVRNLLSRHSLEVVDEWITPSGEEGAFLLRRKEA